MAEPPPLYRRSPDGWELVECENCHLLTAEFVRLTRELAEAQERVARVREFLDRDEHVVDIQRYGFGLQHGFPCRPDLLGCPVNRALEALDDSPHPIDGRYRIWLDQDGAVVIGERVADDYDPLDLRAALAGEDAACDLRHVHDGSEGPCHRFGEGTADQPNAVTSFRPDAVQLPPRGSVRRSTEESV